MCLNNQINLVYIINRKPWFQWNIGNEIWYKKRKGKNLNQESYLTGFTFILKSTTKTAKPKSSQKLKIDEYSKDQ